MSFVHSAMDNEVLISKVFMNPAIWNKHIKEHCNRGIIDNTWREIAKEMGFNEILLRKKWKYLRDQFAVEYGKIQADRLEGGESTYTPKWPYYKSLLFLKDVVKPRDAARYYRPPQEKKLDEGEDAAEFDVFAKEEYNTTYDGEKEQEDTSPSNSQSLDTAPARLSRKRKCYIPSANYNESALEMEMRKNLMLQNVPKESEDDDLMFFKSLLPYVRSLTPLLKLRCRKQILDVVEQFFEHENQSGQLSPKFQ